jgi:hypothetical protein
MRKNSPAPEGLRAPYLSNDFTLVDRHPVLHNEQAHDLILDRTQGKAGVSVVDGSAIDVSKELFEPIPVSARSLEFHSRYEPVKDGEESFLERENFLKRKNGIAHAFDQAADASAGRYN